MKYGVKLLLGAEDVASGWPAFTILDRALRRHGPWPVGSLGDWELKLADYNLATDSYLLAFQCWPKSGS